MSAVASGKLRLMPWGLLTGAAIALAGLFVVFPLGTVLLNSIDAGGNPLAGFIRFFETPAYRDALINTAILASAVTITTILIGVPVAYVVARFDFPFKNAVALLPVATIIIPEVIVCQSWLLLIGNNGVLSNGLREIGIAPPSLYSWGGMIFVMTLVYYTYVYLGTLAALRGFDGQLEEASRNLGYSPGRTSLRVTIPVIAPAILVNALVVFTLAAGNFAVAMILGNRIPLLSLATYNAFVSEMGGSPLMQSTLAVVMVSLVALVLFVQKRIVERRMVQVVQGRAPVPTRIATWKGAALAAGVFVLVAISLVPLITVAIAAVTETRGPVMRWGSFSLANLQRIVDFGLEPILNSLRFAAFATAIGVCFAVITSYLIVKKQSWLTQTLDYLVVLPLTISGTVLGIALVQAFNSGWIVLTGTAAIMVATYVIRRVPFSVRSASSMLYNIPDSLEEASISLGVPPGRSFLKVVLPLMLPSIATAAVLMWSTTLSELSASIVVYGGGLETMPIAIFRLIDGGRMGQASAYGLVLVTLIVVPIFLAVKFGRLNLFSSK
jgi:iron(III) transport system permease protein